jgi:hypothetical protein
VAEKAFPLPLDSMGLGQTETGETILQLGVGQTTLAFLMPMNATEKLGQSLLGNDCFHGQPRCEPASNISTACRSRNEWEARGSLMAMGKRHRS